MMSDEAGGSEGVTVCRSIFTVENSALLKRTGSCPLFCLVGEVLCLTLHSGTTFVLYFV